jgi:hypothetical protein
MRRIGPIAIQLVRVLLAGVLSFFVLRISRAIPLHWGSPLDQWGLWLSQSFPNLRKASRICSPPPAAPPQASIDRCVVAPETRCVPRHLDLPIRSIVGKPHSEDRPEVPTKSSVRQFDAVLHGKLYTEG